VTAFLLRRGKNGKENKTELTNVVHQLCFAVCLNKKSALRSVAAQSADGTKSLQRDGAVRLNAAGALFLAPFAEVGLHVDVAKAGLSFLEHAEGHRAAQARFCKRAEDGCGAVLRLSETTGAAQEATICAPMLNRTIPVALDAFKLKTLYVPDDASLPVREVPLTEL